MKRATWWKLGTGFAILIIYGAANALAQTTVWSGRKWTVSTTSGIDHGSTSTQGAFAYILDQIGSDSARVVFPGDTTFVVSTAISVTQNVEIDYEPGALLQPANGIAIEFDEGSIIPHTWQFFDTSQGGTFDIQGLRNPFVYAEMWGATGDGTTDDSTDIQAAIDATSGTDIDTGELGDGKIVQLLSRPYYTGTTSLTVREKTRLYGTGRPQLISSVVAGGTFIDYDGTGSAITTDQASTDKIRDTEIKGLGIYCGHATDSTGITMDYTTGFVIERVYMNNCSDFGIKIMSSHHGYVAHNKVLMRDVSEGAAFYFEVDDANTEFSGQTTILANEFHNGNKGIHIFQDTANTLTNLYIAQTHVRSNEYGVYLEGDGTQSNQSIQTITFDTCHFENNTTYDVYVGPWVKYGSRFVNCYTNNAKDHENEWSWYLLGENIQIEGGQFEGYNAAQAVYTYGIYAAGRHIKIDGQFFFRTKRPIYVAPAAYDVTLGYSSIDGTGGEAITTFEHYSLNEAGDDLGWGVSAAGNNIYYLIESAGGAVTTGFAPALDSFPTPDSMTGPDANDLPGKYYLEATAATLSAGEWDYGCVATDPCDAGGYSTIYIRLLGATADPESLTDTVYGSWRNTQYIGERWVQSDQFDLDNNTFSVRDGNYEWTVSGVGATEYYSESLPDTTRPARMATEPNTVLENGSAMVNGTLGALAAGEYDWGCSAGDPCAVGAYDTLYVRLTDSADPDSKAQDFVEVIYTTIENNYLIPQLPVQYWVKEVQLVYEEATSSNTGVTLRFGTKEDTNYVWEQTSHVSASKHDTYVYHTPTARELDPYRRMLFGNAAGKIGVGAARIFVRLIPFDFTGDTVTW